MQTTVSGISVSGNAAISGAISGNSLTISGSATVGSLRVNGNIEATGDISAFVSDDRLKTDKVLINNALEKVCSLNGFTYKFNETAGKLGLDTTETHVGVSAQEVQAILPEVTGPAPIDNNYITVKYDKLVPLLIEAIKDLKKEIEDLKSSK